MNRLAILEDNLEFSRNLLNYIVSRNKKIRLSSLAINGEEIMESVHYLGKGDILLLDLGLPKINGLEVIDKLKQKKGQMPYIIVMSGDMELFQKLKDYTPYIYAAIEKPFAFNRIVDIIEDITYETDQKCYEELVKEELRKFEMNITTIGYAYIVDAITFSLEDETLLKDMQNALYKSVSIKNNNVNVSNIKWAIEKCVKSTKRYTSTSTIKSYFHVEAREKITPKLFISTVVENLKSKIEDEMNVKKEEVYY
ncbi:MAG: response regulator [Clostridia bacterium]|nr:response regulator [Clostridia bacterium]